MVLLLLCGVNAAVFPLVTPYERFGWVRQSAGAYELVKFTLAVHQRNWEKLQQLALGSGTPGSGLYGRHLSKHEIDSLTAPDPEQVRVVAEWLTVHGAMFTIRHERIEVQLSLAKAKAMLHTTFGRYRRAHQPTVAILRADGAFTLPPRVASAVAAVFGLHGMPLPEHPMAIRPLQQPCSLDANVTPAVINVTYSLRYATVARGSTNRQAVAEFQGERMLKSDLNRFFSNYVPDRAKGDDRVSKFVGSRYKPFIPGGDVEAQLDIQYLMGVADGVSTEFWAWEGNDFCGDLYNYTGALLAAANPPLVNSISYGWQGNLSELNCLEQAGLIDQQLAKLAARGLSLIVASGDSGSGFTSGSQCSSGSGKTGVEVKAGNFSRHLNASRSACCQASSYQDAMAWVWTPPAHAAGAAPRATEGVVRQKSRLMGALEWGERADEAGQQALPVNYSFVGALCDRSEIRTHQSALAMRMQAHRLIGVCSHYLLPPATQFTCCQAAPCRAPSPRENSFNLMGRSQQMAALYACTTSTTHCPTQCSPSARRFI